MNIFDAKLPNLVRINGETYFVLKLITYPEMYELRAISFDIKSPDTNVKIHVIDSKDVKDIELVDELTYKELIKFKGITYLLNDYFDLNEENVSDKYDEMFMKMVKYFDRNGFYVGPDEGD